MRRDDLFSPGTELYSVAVGALPFLPWRRRYAVDRLSSLAGFAAIHPMGSATLLFFESLNDAKVARNVIRAEGGAAGDNICLWRITGDGVPEFVGGAD